VPTAERVARAVESLRARLAPDVAVELVSLGDDGVVRLRVAGEGAGCGGTGKALARGIENALLEAAPELARIELDGIGGDPPERLVTLRGPQAVGSATP
jgi:Fe-S cluster biogenesis protein NfuA